MLKNIKLNIRVIVIKDILNVIKLNKKYIMKYIFIMRGGFMKVVKIKRSTILKVLLLFVFTFTITKVTNSFGMQHYYKLDFSTGIVTASTLNVRSGPRNKLPSGCKS